MKARVRERWRQLPRRDRQLCGVLAVFLSMVFGFYGLWQPAQQRAQPTRATRVYTQPLSSRLSESAASAGLQVQQFDVDTQRIRISLSGNAMAVLEWLNRIEQEGAEFENLSLEKSAQVLQVQLQISNP